MLMLSKRVAAMGLFGLLMGTPAWAELSFCNDTGVEATVAIGYMGDSDWTSEGWWSVAPGACTVAAVDLEPSSYYYWRAIDENGDYEAEDYYFCTSQKVFTIVGDSRCEERGYEREKFSEIRIGEDGSASVRLTAALAPAATSQRKAPEPEPETATRESAEPAPTAVVHDFPQIVQNLLGEWRNAENRPLTILIERNRLEDLFLGASMAKASWRLAGSCPGSEGVGPVMLITYEGSTQGESCWLLLGLDETELLVEKLSTSEQVSYIKD